MRFKGKVSFVEKNGGWFARGVYSENGKQKQVWRKVLSTKSEAKLEVIEEIERRLNPAPETDKTFKDLARYYNEHHAIPARFEEDVKIAGKKTWQQMRHCITYMEKFFGDEKLKTITRDRIQDYRLHVLDKKVKHIVDGKSVYKTRSLASVNQHVKILRAMLNVAASNDWIPKVPSFKELISNASERSRDIIPTEAEFEQILFSAQKRAPNVLVVILMIADIGARPVEVFNLTWGDIDGRRITLTSDKGKRRARRTLVATERLLEALSHLDRHTPTVVGVTTIKQPWKTIQRDTGLFHLTPYHLRHLFASRIDRLPISQLAKQKLMGHSDGAMFGRYAKMSEDLAAEVAASLDQNPYLPITDTIQ